MTKVVVIGAGIIGASCAYHLARAGAGVDVTVIDRGQVGSGTTSRGEGNIELSDKCAGPELELMQLSRQLWLDTAGDLGAEALELEPKGSLVVATSPGAFDQLQEFAARQREAGVRSEVVSRPSALEPNLAPDLPGAVSYPNDMQVQPAKAAAALLAAARRRGARFVGGQPVVGASHDSSGAVTAVQTPTETIPADVVVNAAGTWAGAVGALLGSTVPVSPRRGYVLVTEPLPRVVGRKVYSADYVDNVASSSAALETSCVVEGTESGTVLIGASRELVGFDETVQPHIISALAANAVRLFPGLRPVKMMRMYWGFRPFSPDHLPIIGPDARVTGLYHACGHEGAGIGLSAATGHVISRLIKGHALSIDIAPFSPARFGH
ncbi:NAD(P)/FAD-dependent oxidoreductase [Streptomyces arenae]|uniref:NAD(P)/FAD-dependent oxidoreductase n=1 Tax=Streptomyces arenae TaxID=29301 RepID=UPI002658CAC2|nr:FAD-binding oxidoreductase [Streptomyces arenae]MCG7207444.1 FAD-binding oxidoreductase [Streptomyces arenae]